MSWIFLSMGLGCLGVLWNFAVYGYETSVIETMYGIGIAYIIAGTYHRING